jgi:hypothetical protein
VGGNGRVSCARESLDGPATATTTMARMEQKSVFMFLCWLWVSFFDALGRDYFALGVYQMGEV